MKQDLQVLSPAQYQAMVKEREQMINYIAELETRQPIATITPSYIPQDSKQEWVNKAGRFEKRSATTTHEYKSSSTLAPWVVLAIGIIFAWLILKGCIIL